MAGVEPEVEYLYMPSNWVKRVPVEDSCRLHVEVTTRDSKEARGHATAKLGVSIGPGREDVVDIFNEKGTSGGLVVYISGGYWLELNGNISAYPVKPLIAAGHSVIIVHYDRAPLQDLAGIVQQVERSVAWCLRWAESNNKKVWLSGHSAGGHLCALTLSSAWFQGLPGRSQQAVEGVVHFSGVFDLKPIRSTSINTVLKLTPGEAERFSPLAQENILRLVEYKHMKHHFLVGEFDSPPFHQQAEAYRSALSERGLETSLTTLADLDHFNLVENLADEDSSSTKTFLNLLTSSE